MPTEVSDRFGWHHRGYLPHFDGPSVIQSVTYRLADSLPAEVLRRYQAAVRDFPEEERQLRLRQRIERFLDAGHGSCVLRRPEIARLVIDNWIHLAEGRYRLHAWVVMPNHVHVVCEPLGGHALAGIVTSWKSYTALQINRHLARRGPLWMADYWDRFIRDADHYRRVIAYVHDNPVKAGLASSAMDWPWSSAASRA